MAGGHDLALLRPGGQLGPYRIGRELGRGGMGAVFEAFDSRAGRRVALKVVSGLDDRTARARFEREARTLAKVSHPNIVTLYEAASHGRVVVVALELVSGRSLEALLRERGPLEPVEAARFLAPIARALHATHALGVVHRDVKPANILVDEAGIPKLTDFGLARDVTADSLTRTGDVLGTPAFMAPEQADGAGSRSVGPAVDVYALGATLYALLTGGPPFEGDTLQVLKKVLMERPQRPSEVRCARGLARLPGDLEALVLRALAKDPRERPASAEAFAEELERGGRPARRRVRSRRRAWLVGLAGIFVATVAVTALVRSRAPAPSSPPVTTPPGGHRPPAPASSPSRFEPGDAERLRARARRHIAQANELFDDGRVAEALAEYRRATEIDRTSADAWAHLAVAHLALGQLVEGEDAARQAVDLDPTLARAQTTLAGALLQTRRKDALPEALRAIDLAVSAAPRDAPAAKIRAKILLQMKDATATIDEATRAIELDPGDQDMWILRGVARGFLGQHGEALADLDRAVELQPDSAHTRRARSRVRARAGDLAGARADLESVLARLGSDDPARGDIEADLGRLGVRGR